MKYVLLALLAMWAGTVSAQAPLLLPTRSLAEELVAGTSLGWRGMFLAGVAYQPVEEAWLKESFLPKFQLMVKRLRMKSAAEGFDCDNFASLFKAELQVENYLAGNSTLGEVACGVLIVAQRHSWGRVMASRDLHSLVLVRTDKGWRVIEPQTMRMATLDKYPNRGTMSAVYF